ncbi:MAG: cyclopropane-fatty-acyl-phospholipid synthase family protein [Rhizobiaceae bacterium]|nr:cyclopropane-fatty-acyl-phospholipid synthase family protein [Rhizobiaceae bacterium]MCV0405738.1 cyclopropane-fatty-acyl-phospholipid synthase family protein [Rhizobiaceae bacterium]
MSHDEKAADMVRVLVETIGPNFSVELWTGVRIGRADGGVALKIAGPDVLRRLILRPNIGTIAELWAEGRVDVTGGSLFDLVERGSTGKLKAKLRDLPRWRLLKGLPAVLMGRGGTVATAGLAGRNADIAGSDKTAISHHYDVSNAFYRLFLDSRMVYSCGYFTDWANDIDTAQRDKLDHICRKLRLAPGETFLDIGCGWGALLIHAARNYGVTATGVSLSEAQTELARERIRAEGLEDRITIQVTPYQELEGRFDKIASVGMFEHVGIANHPAYFAAVRRLLKPGGIYLHHAITRRMKKSKSAFARKSAEHRALVKYIFPGGELDHIGMTLGNLEAHGFEVHDVENLREHYGRTCRLWAERLGARMDEATAEVGAPRARLWLLYLTGCALAFERGTVQINQTVATPRKRGPSGLPPTRADLYQ